METIELAFSIFIMKSSLTEEQSWSCIIALGEVGSTEKLGLRQKAAHLSSYQVET